MPPTNGEMPNWPYIVVLGDSTELRDWWKPYGTTRWGKPFFQYHGPANNEDEPGCGPGAITWVRPLRPLADGWKSAVDEEIRCCEWFLWRNTGTR